MNGQPHENRIQLVLLATQALFRTSLGRLLASEHTLEVVAECGSAIAALDILSSARVDMVLLDCDDGVEAVSSFMATARRGGYQGRFLAIMGAVDFDNAVLAIKLGAAGVFLKSDAPDRLVQAIKLVADGAAWLDERICDCWRISQPNICI